MNTARKGKTKHMDINQVITGELGVKRWQVDAAVKLIDEGNTIPFIARYRKEVTGTLDDAQLRTLYERLVYLRNLEEKKEQVLSSIEEQGKLTGELKKQILAAETMVVVEDLYRPYRPKRRTRAMIAKEKGLEPLAAVITLQKADKPVEVYAEEYVNPEKEVNSVKEAIDGAKDIIAESVSDEADYRIWIRKATVQHGKVISQAKDERFAQPPRDLDYNRENLPWRVQADIAGGGYFYIHHKDRPFARRQRAGNFIGKVHMPGRIDEP